MNALFRSLLLSSALVFLAAEAGAQSIRASTYSGPAAAWTSHGRRPSYESSRVWIPGRSETTYERVWVPGRTERVWVDPEWSIRIDACGRAVRVLVCAGHWERVHRPGHYELQPRTRWIPGRWVARGSCD